jgi:hypothetical protein
MHQDNREIHPASSLPGKKDLPEHAARAFDAKLRPKAEVTAPPRLREIGI